MGWQKDMKKMRLAYLEKTSPGFFEASGGFTMEVWPYSDNTVIALTRSITDYLKFNGWSVNRKGDCIRATTPGKHIQISVGGAQNHERVDFVAKDFPSFLQWFSHVK